MQTVVEWLEKEIWRRGPIGQDTPTWLKELFEQAKEMEKQQIIDTFNEGQEYEYQYHINNAPKFDSETYFTETYGSKGSDEKKEYPHSHIYETMNGKYGLSSYNEHDQTDGIFDTYQEAVDFGLSLIKSTTSSQTEISDEEIEKEIHKRYMNPIQDYAWRDACKWYREQLKCKGNGNK